MKTHVWRRRGLCAAGFVALLLVALPQAGVAQTRRGNPPSGSALQQGEPSVAPAEIQRMLDGYELMQAQDILQLGDEQFPRFLPRLKALQDARRRAQMERNRVVQELRRMTQARAGTVDEARVRERVNALDELEERSASEIRQARKALDQVLDVQQQARFRIFEEMMEQRKVELLMRARQANRLQNRPSARPQNQF
jgi:hypothetical protein